MSNVRDPKWFVVPPGARIPAGQPYARDLREVNAGSQIWGEYVNPQGDVFASPAGTWYVDSTWRKPLPKEPTWGLVSTRLIPAWRVGKWFLSDNKTRLIDAVTDQPGPWTHSDCKFIPLTPEQVEEVESREQRKVRSMNTPSF